MNTPSARSACAIMVVAGLLSLCGCAPDPGAARAAADFPATGPAQAHHADSTTFRVHHALSVTDIPAGARKVRVWFWWPDDAAGQKVLDVRVTGAPAGYRVTRDAAHGHRYLYAEVDEPRSPDVSLGTDFVVRRTAVPPAVDPDRVGPLTDGHRAVFAEYLRADCPHMEVTNPVKEIAARVCGDEANAARQARALAEWVVGHSDHYSLPGAPKSSGQGDAAYCLANGGGGCTDQHALFIALARARGIPTRLQFGSLLRAKDEGRDVDPGYRCWAEYFAPGCGWVPMDLSAADTATDLGDRARYLGGGLDARRVRFAEGRDLDLNPRQDGPRVNLLLGAYVEVDGRPHAAFRRSLRFTEDR